MGRKKYELSPREENVREVHPVVSSPLHFSLDEIKQHFDDNLNELIKQFDLAESLEKNGDTSGCKGIWRSQVVFAEGLMDFYIHEISKYCLYRMFAGLTGKTEKYASIRIPLQEVESAFSANTLDEKCDWFFKYINKHICRDVYLAAEVMQDQLNLIGIPFRDVMAIAFPLDDQNQIVKNGREIVSKMFSRRNKIAHQNDRSHATVEQTDITRQYVEDYINNVKKIVNAIHQIAMSKESDSTS